MLCFFSHTIYLAFTFHRSPKSLNKMIFTFIRPLESETRTYSIARENKIFFVIKMLRLLVISFIIKLYSRVSVFTKYCILVCQNFPPSKIPSYTPVMKWKEHFQSLQYDKWKTLYDKKYFSLKPCKKRK